MSTARFAGSWDGAADRASSRIIHVTTLAPTNGRSRDNTPSIALLRAVWAAVEDEPQRDLVQFLLLVPLRRGEASGLTWREVDLDLGRIRIAGERMKKGAAHELPLSGAALAILRRCKANGGALVFPTAAGKPFNGWTHLVRRIRKRIGQASVVKSEVFTFHDTRRSFVSTLAERGIPKEQQPQGAPAVFVDVDLLDQCLSHTRKGVLGVYQRASRMNDRAAALRAWATYLLDEAQPSNVVPIARRSNV
jgi:integrase